jgi:Na+-driven multidrug efflux pump
MISFSARTFSNNLNIILNNFPKHLFRISLYSVRVGNELGAGHAKAAEFSVVVVTLVSFVISVTLALILLACRDYISYIFTEGETVARAVSDLSPLLATTLILNGIQPVLSGNTLFSEIFNLFNLNLITIFIKYNKVNGQMLKSSLIVQ